MDKRIGAQFYTLREFIQTVEDFEETCRKVSEMGYKIVQISGTSLKASDMKPVLDKYGLEVMLTHRQWNDFRENLEDIIDYNKTLGSELCGLGMMPFNLAETSENLSQFINEANAVAKKLRAEGLYFGYHNHAFEFSKLNGKYVMDRLLEENDPEEFKLIVDVYWLWVGGANPAEFIRKNGNRIMAIHFKDLKVNFNNTTEMAEIGVGNLNWDDIIAACEESGAKWAFVEQDTCQTDPFECMKTSYEYLVGKGFC